MSGLKLVWECDALAHCTIEHHRGYLYLFTDAPKGGRSVECHYLLCSPVDLSSTRKWEVVWNITFFFLSMVDLFHFFPSFYIISKTCVYLKQWDNLLLHSYFHVFLVNLPVQSALPYMSYLASWTAGGISWWPRFDYWGYWF